MSVSNRKSVFVGACMGMLLFGVSLITLGSIAVDLQARFEMDAIEAGTLFSILPIGILVGSFIFGPVIDRYGYKLLLVSACAAMFAGFQGIAFSASLGSLRASIFLFGIGAGVINGATNALVADISEENRGANLSILGVFFGLGALGMPLVLGVVSGTFEPYQVLSAVGWATLAVGVYFAAIGLPKGKESARTEAGSWVRLASPLLILVAFFLFWQSALEAIINNWTTTYVTRRGVMSESNALYALSLHIVGMVAMRLLMGTVLRRVSQVLIVWACLVLLVAGVLLMQIGHTFEVATAGLILSGAGLAGGFPIMLGLVGERFAELSGTAFSFVFVVALIGNMAVNYLTGVVIHLHGVEQLTTVSYVGAGVMALLFFFIVRRLGDEKGVNRDRAPGL